MHKLTIFFKSPTILILLLVLSIGLFFRNYKVIERFDFAHDHDLYSWIAKDIIVDKHPRLIGQLTSAEGIYIGPLYYYLNIPFFLMFNMDPIGTILPISIIGFLSLLSIYLVFKNLYNPTVALITTFLYASSWHILQLDRRLAPSTPTYLWAIWYFYCLIKISRGNYNVLPILGILLGLIWHIHVAILPALIAIPAAVIVSKKLPNLKQISLFVIAAFVSSLPLLIFELRHNFIQTFSLLGNFTKTHAGSTGTYKFQQVLTMISKNLNDIFFTPLEIPFFNTVLILILFILIGFFLIFKKVIKIKEYVVLLTWMIGLIIFFTLSSSPISEYYFANMDIVFLFIAGFALYFIWRSIKFGSFIVLVLLTGLFVKTFISINGDYYNKGYLERKATLEFIQKDMSKNSYPCISISYITAPGENVGFRYLLWLYEIKTVKVNTGAPIYNIVIPDELSLGNIDGKFGHIGVILPKNEIDRSTPEKIQEACKQENSNLTDPMFGFVN